MNTDTVSILEGNAFVVSQLNGDIVASPTTPTGFFAWDTRFLSRWQLTVNGQELNALSTDNIDYFFVQFFLVPGTGATYIDADLSVMRKRSIDRGFIEEVQCINHKKSAVDLTLHLEIESDFADLFEVKDALKKKGSYYQRTEGQTVILGYQREKFFRETLVTAPDATHLDGQGITFSAHIKPHSSWSTRLEVGFKGTALVDTVSKDDKTTQAKLPQSRQREDIKHMLAAAPKLKCDWDFLEFIYTRSLIDLAALRFFPNTLPGQALPAAGLPWFMTVFGRDSIITSLQALPFVPELAITTLQALAQWQGARDDPFRDEEPGKIIHEVRFGEMTAFEERPQSPYYGSADATPLFLILLDEVERWTGNATLVKDLEHEARAALRWIDVYGDRNKDGYIEYNRRNTELGLENQCWKDSWNSILFADGSMSRLPRATCEIQGYVYDAKMRCARLARQFWSDPALAARLESEAADLKRRFNQDYWLPEREFFALAIDGDGRKVDALTSNIGHLLWSGIVDTDKAEACARHLMSPQLFSGWGVRTMAEGEGGYNPIGYHLGTVWPHDNSLIALGLRRYGFDEAAARIALGIFDAARFFLGRLPEAFAGYDKQWTNYPVEYPTACSPQAWATGTPLLLIRAILGLEPLQNHLIINPAIPKELGSLELLDIQGRWGYIDAFGRGLIHVPETFTTKHFN